MELNFIIPHIKVCFDTTFSSTKTLITFKIGKIYLYLSRSLAKFEYPDEIVSSSTPSLKCYDCDIRGGINQLARSFCCGSWKDYSVTTNFLLKIKMLWRFQEVLKL
jgi:hypothetical protein